jgi:cytochrome c oxidase cbb3-type subunit 3
MSSRYLDLAMAVLAVATAGCEREKRELHPPTSAAPGQEMQLISVRAGGGAPPANAPFRYDNNAYAQSQGQQLFEQFNCGTCHASKGGGDIGPPLLDNKWIYGWEPQQIYASIVEGRPNGMPSFRGKIEEGQVWQLVAYVRSLGGLVSKTAAPGRDDHLNAGSPPNSRPQQQPVPVSGQNP